MVDFFIESNANEVIRRFNVRLHQLNGALKDAAKEQEREALRLFKGTTRNWRHQVEFVSDIDVRGTTVSMIVGTDDKIYRFLDKGTRVRRAIMSNDWQSKTKPGSLKSGKGKGRVVFISKKVNRPGIKARNFTGQIFKIITRTAPNIFAKHLKRWARR